MTTQISYEPKQFWGARQKIAIFCARTPLASVREPPKLLCLDKICLVVIFHFSFAPAPKVWPWEISCLRPDLWSI